MANQDSKRSMGVVVAWVVGACFGVSILVSVGKSLGLVGVFLGVVAVAGGVGLFLKGPPHFRKASFGAVGLGALLALFGFGGARESAAQREEEAALAARASKAASDNRVEFDKVAAQLSALGASSSPKTVAATCLALAKLGDIPSAQSAQCASALLSEGREALKDKRTAESVGLLQLAVRCGPAMKEASDALRDAKLALAIEGGSADADRAEVALAASDNEGALKAARAGVVKVEPALKANPSDATLAALSERLGAVLAKTDPDKVAAAAKVVFAAMSARDHVVAAKAALADGYDAATKMGGRLDDAQANLSVIDGAAPEAKEAKLLLGEVETRRKRSEQASKLAALMADVAKDASYELKQGRLLVTDEVANIGERKQDITVGGHLTLGFIAAKLDDLPDVQVITVVENSTFVDTRGNSKPIKVGEFTVSRSKAKTINWTKIRSENILKVIDKAWIAPGVATTVD